MSRIDRLKEYAKPTRAANWNGASRDQTNIDRFSDRASAHSNQATRATDHPIILPDTGKRTERSTKSAPRTSADIDAAMAGKNDLNHVGGSDYMKSIRRDA